MAERNIRLLLQSVALESSKTVAESGTVMKAGDVATIVITIVIFAVFIAGMSSVCYRWSFNQFHSMDRNGFEDFDVHTERSWSITVARGIDPEIVKSFPTFLFSEVKERRIGKGGVECAVCLCEFEDNETLCLMPSCCHVFHADCANTWLVDHSTCPLCRVELAFQSGEGSESGLSSIDRDLLQGVTWNDRNSSYTSMSTRLTQCRAAQVLFSRSHSTGHCVAQPVENFDRFKLRLPEDVQRQLMKKNTVDHEPLNPVRRSEQRIYRSKSVGSVISNKRDNYNNNRRLHSMAFSFSDSCGGDAVVHSKRMPRSIDPCQQSFGRLQSRDHCQHSFGRLQPDDQVINIIRLSDLPIFKE